MKSIFKLLVFAFAISLTSCKAQYPDLDDGMYAEFITDKGVMVAKLEYEKVPITVANFVSLAEGTNTMVDEKYKDKKYYNGITFHRVIDDFMIQGGDPTASGTGSPGYKFDDEFDITLKHDKKGILAMANPGANANGSQFYITHKETPWLDAFDKEGNLKACENPRVYCHSVFGEVLIGIEIIDSVKQNDVIKELNIIRKGSDAKKFDAAKIFSSHLIEAEKLAKEKEARAKKIIEDTKAKFNKQKEEAITLPSGLQYIVTEKGSGKKLHEMAKISTHYAVYFENGKLLQTSDLKIAEACDAVDEQLKAAGRYQPIEADISPDAQMIAGFKEGLKQLSVGDKATIFVPYHLGYGEAGRPGIPPRSNLIFEVEVIELLN